MTYREKMEEGMGYGTVAIGVEKVFEIIDEADKEVEHLKSAALVAINAAQVNDRFTTVEVARLQAEVDALRETVRELLAEAAEERADFLIDAARDKGDEAMAAAREKINAEKEAAR